MNDYYIVALFCEDVRREASGQETIVGTIPDTMKVNMVPGMIPKLAVYIRANFNPEFKIDNFSSILFDPEGNECGSLIVDIQLIRDGFENAKMHGSPFVGIKSVFTFSPIRIGKEGRFEVKTTVNKRTFVSGFLTIVLAQPESDGGSG